MHTELSVSEAERMLLKINKIGKHHENAKFLANECLSDLRNADRHLHELDSEDQVRMREKIAKLRLQIKELGIV